MAWHIHCDRCHAGYFEVFIVLEEIIEQPVGLVIFRLKVVDLSEDSLHGFYFLARRYLSSCLAADIRRR
ncbi:hypothetical protein D3C86_1975280 [compost metagenome]